MLGAVLWCPSQGNQNDRRGLECPEERAMLRGEFVSALAGCFLRSLKERDYFPYWHPTPWHDIATQRKSGRPKQGQCALECSVQAIITDEPLEPLTREPLDAESPQKARSWQSQVQKMHLLPKRIAERASKRPKRPFGHAVLEAIAANRSTTTPKLARDPEQRVRKA